MFGPLCVSVAEVEPQGAARQLHGLHCAELRLDALEAIPENLDQLVGIPEQCLLTCRPGSLSTDEQLHRLTRGIKACPALLDLDMDAPGELRQPVLDKAVQAGIKVVVSRHWYKATPQLHVLIETVRSLLSMGTEYVKVATLCKTDMDLINLISLYTHFYLERHRLVVLAMGPLGVLARLFILQLGAPFTFVAPNRGPKTAPGQMRLESAQEILQKAGVL